MTTHAVALDDNGSLQFKTFVGEQSLLKVPFLLGFACLLFEPANRQGSRPKLLHFPCPVHSTGLVSDFCRIALGNVFFIRAKLKKTLLAVKPLNVFSTLSFPNFDFCESKRTIDSSPFSTARTPHFLILLALFVVACRDSCAGVLSPGRSLW